MTFQKHTKTIFFISLIAEQKFVPTENTFLPYKLKSCVLRHSVDADDYRKSRLIYDDDYEC